MSLIITQRKKNTITLFAEAMVISISIECVSYRFSYGLITKLDFHLPIYYSILMYERQKLPISEQLLWSYNHRRLQGQYTTFYLLLHVMNLWGKLQILLTFIPHRFYQFEARNPLHISPLGLK